MWDRQKSRGIYHAGGVESGSIWRLNRSVVHQTPRLPKEEEAKPEFIKKGEFEV